MTDSATTLQFEGDEISLLDILITLAESWRLLVFGPLLVGLLAAALSLLWPKTFESVAILRLTEEEIALLHAAPVLDQLIEKYDYLQASDGVKVDARKAVKADLIFSNDKRTRLATVIAKGRTPEAAQVLGKAAIDALLQELQPKGKEKEAILQEMAINNQLISEGVVLVERQSGRVDNANANANANANTNTKGQIANLKLNNLELSLKLQPKGQEVFVQEPDFPQRKSMPKLSTVVALAVLGSGFMLLIFVLARKAWQSAAKNPQSADKVVRIYQLLGLNKL